MEENLNQLSHSPNNGVEVLSENVEPQNIEAEQALLGALLVNNDVYDKVQSIIRSEHFYDPVHSRIYEAASQKITKNSW